MKNKMGNWQLILDYLYFNPGATKAEVLTHVYELQVRTWTKQDNCNNWYFLSSPWWRKYGGDGVAYFGGHSKCGIDFGYIKLSGKKGRSNVFEITDAGLEKLNRMKNGATR